MNANWVKYLPGFIRGKFEDRHGFQAALSNSYWLLVDKLFRMGVGLFVGAWTARYLGPQQFGLWNFAIAFAAMFSVFSTLGLDGIVVLELVKHPERRNVILGSAFFLKIIGGLISLMLALVVIAITRSGDILVFWLVGISAAGYIFQALNVIDFYFQSKVQSKYTVYCANAAFILLTVAKVCLLLIAAPLIAFAFAGLIEIVLTSVFLLIAYRVNALDMRDWRYDRDVMFQLLRNSGPLILAGLAVMLYTRIDVVMLQQMIGEREVGVYAAATRISEIWYFLPMIIVSSVSPAIIRAHALDAVLYITKLKQLYFFLVWLAIGISLPLSFLSTTIVGAIFGEEFAEAAPVLAIHLWASIAVFLGVASSQYLLVEQLQKISFYRTLIGLFLNILINLILIPSMGAKGAAAATVISYFAAVFALAFFKRTRAHSMYLLLSPFTRK